MYPNKRRATLMSMFGLYEEFELHIGLWYLDLITMKFFCQKS